MSNMQRIRRIKGMGGGDGPGTATPYKSVKPAPKAYEQLGSKTKSVSDKLSKGKSPQADTIVEDLD